MSNVNVNVVSSGRIKRQNRHLRLKPWPCTLVTAIFSRVPLAPVSCFVRGTKGVTYPINAASFHAKGKVPRYHHS